MSRDPLDTVLKVRQQAVDDARQVLAANLRTEAVAQTLADASEACLAAEADAAADLAAGDGTVEAFIRWLPVGRSNAAMTRRRLERAQADVAIARATLSVVRAAAEAAKTLLERRAAERLAVIARRTQQDMDEVASRQRPHSI